MQSPETYYWQLKAVDAITITLKELLHAMKSKCLFLSMGNLHRNA